MLPFPLEDSSEEGQLSLEMPLQDLLSMLPVEVSPLSTTLPVPDLSFSFPETSAPPSTQRSKSKKIVVDEAPPGTKFPYITGHCANGAHEGNKTFSARGTLLQPCRGMYTWRFTSAFCTCWCHELAATVRTMTAVTSDPLFVGTHGLVSAADVAASVASAPMPIAVNMPEVVITQDPHWLYRQMIASPKVSTQLANMVRVKILNEEAQEYSADESGERRRRGELDANVEIVCRLWLDKLLPWELLTTDAISIMVDAEDPPSQGAIYSVLNRWANRGFAMIGTKPMRFIGFNESVLKMGLEAAVHKANREADRRSKGMF